jgi:hypothetical protein
MATTRNGRATSGSRMPVSVKRKGSAAYWAALEQKLGAAKSVKVGFLAGATYPEGTSVAAVAAYNEYGTATSPSRPFFRNMIAEQSPTWPAKLKAVMQRSDMNTHQALDIMGQEIAGRLTESINKFEGVPLAPSTIKAKGFDKQLVETAVMLRSVSYEVVEE